MHFLFFREPHDYITITFGGDYGTVRHTNTKPNYYRLLLMARVEEHSREFATEVGWVIYLSTHSSVTIIDVAHCCHLERK